MYKNRGFMKDMDKTVLLRMRVETEQGRCLMQIPVEKIGLFIEELDAIRRNAANWQALPF